MIAGSMLRGSALRGSTPDNPNRKPVVGARLRLARGTFAGLVLGALAYVIVNDGLFGSAGSVLLAGLLLIAAPTAHQMAPRLATNISLTLGVTPTLWWIRWPADVSHAAVLAGAGVGLVAMFVGIAPVVRDRLNTLLPSAAAIDVLILGGVAVSFFVVHKLAMARTAIGALAELLPGVDNHVHVGIFVALRRTGVILSSAGPAPDGSEWAWANYPAGFHTVVATISELLSPAVPLGSASFVSYAHSVAVLVMLGTALVTAAVLGVPSIRRHPALASASLAATWGALLWDPGQKALANGFGNFWLAAVMVGTALVLILHPRISGNVPTFAPMLLMLMLVAQSWILLVLPAIPAALACLGDVWSYRRRGGPGRVVLCALLPAVCLFGLFQAAILALRAGDVSSLVLASGALDGTSPTPTFLMLAMSVCIIIWYPRLAAPRGMGSTVPCGRIRTAAAGPVLGGAVAVIFLVAQLQALGTSSYYFLKYVTGLEIAMAILVPTLLAHLVSAWEVVTWENARWVKTLAATAAAVMAAASFGWPRAAPALLLSDSNDGTAGIAPPYSRVRMAQGIVRALDGGGRPFQDVYLALGARRAGQAFYPDAWFDGSEGALTERRGTIIDIMRRPATTPLEGAAVAVDVLSKGIPGRVIVAPGDVKAVRAGIEDPSVRSRVVAWGSQQR